MNRRGPLNEQELAKALRPVAVLAFLIPLIQIALCAPMALRMIPPNGGYGYRTPAAMASPEAWYALNAAAGRAGIVAGVLALAAAFLILKSGVGGALWRPLIAMGAGLVLIVGGIALTPLFAG